MAVDPLLRGLLPAFVAESEELSRNAIAALLALERGHSAERADAAVRLARALHTMKGSAATLGLDDLSALAHEMEDAAKKAKEAGSARPGLVDALLQAIDAFVAGVRAEAQGEPATDLAPVRARLSDPGASAAHGSRRRRERDTAWRVDEGTISLLVREVDRLRDVRGRLDERRRELQRTIETLSRANGAERARAIASLADMASALAEDASDAGFVVESFEKGLREISTLPVSTLTDSLERAVRDLCRQLGKEALLTVTGGETSLDRRVLEALRGPLVHLVRNAVDHGIEPPAERERAGKHRRGSLDVRFERVGNVVHVEVADDGRGLETERIREAALLRGLMVPERAGEELSPAEVHRFIFLPDFTTKREVGTTSGRGVGLDVVRTEVEALDGRVEVSTVGGQGTRFTIALPSSLGSSPVLLVRAGDHDMALPVAAVEAVRASAERELRPGDGRIFLEQQGEPVLVRDLGAVLGARAERAPLERGMLVVVRSFGKRVALAVDQVSGIEDLAVRALPPEIRSLGAYQGAVTLPRGEQALVLRAEWLVAQDAPSQAPVPAKLALVVDDSLTARARNRAALEAGGLTVHVASSARKARELLRENAYEVLVLDVAMENEDGLSFTRSLRALPETSDLPIVLVSSHDQDADRARADAAGADAFVGKRECGQGRLLEVVRSVLNGSARGSRAST